MTGLFARSLSSYNVYCFQVGVNTFQNLKFFCSLRRTRVVSVSNYCSIFSKFRMFLNWFIVLIFDWNWGELGLMNWSKKRFMQHLWAINVRRELHALPQIPTRTSRFSSNSKMLSQGRRDLNYPAKTHTMSEALLKKRVSFDWLRLYRIVCDSLEVKHHWSTAN